MSDDLISRQAAIESLLEALYDLDEDDFVDKVFIEKELKRVPSIQFEKEIAKRVLWTGWKGFRNTRYKCPNCKKPVKNDDIYCHRCGQKLMFPQISFTDYNPGEKQELIVRWDDECVRYDRNSIEQGMTITGIEQALNEMPNIQPKQKAGQWLINSDGYYPYCSICKNEPQGRIMTDYCPNCGAKMKK